MAQFSWVGARFALSDSGHPAYEAKHSEAFVSAPRNPRRLLRCSPDCEANFCEEAKTLRPLGNAKLR